MSKTDSSVERPFPHVTGVTTMTTYMKLQEELADARHAYIDMKERALAAEAALAERDNPCVWTYKRYGGWLTTCQVRPASHSVSWKFCPYCGHFIEVAP